MADPRTETSSDYIEPLTMREREILKGLAEGSSNQEIATRMHLALRTVKWYNSQIYSKLGVSNRKAAIELARTRDLLKAAPDTPILTPRDNLPLATTRLVGRQEELAAIARLFGEEDTKLVTILAPGGMGKTRLSLAAAEQQVGRFRDGVFFVPLASQVSPDDTISAIAENVGFSFFGSAPIRQQLLDYLRERQMFLVLDNFEHLLDSALLVADILKTAARVRILVTSRELLKLQGEKVYVLKGLNFSASHSSEHIQDYDAVRLFVLSAQDVHPGYEPQLQDLTQLARICQLTAGMPLAIELAAGWLDTLSLEHIANEIQQGIDILESDLRDVPERHRSVRATFERTWNHLSEDIRLIFMRLSVFRGGFSVQAAQAVAGANAHHLRRLVQKALIQPEASERFAIHELLRQFGADKLAETDAFSTTQARHAEYFADFMQAQRDVIFSSRQFDAVNEIEIDFENIRTAWHVLVDRQAFDDLRKFLDSFRFFLDVRARSEEGIALFERLANVLQSLPPSDAAELALARVWARLAWFYNSTGLSEKGKDAAESAIGLFSRHDSPEDLLVAYESLALIYMLRGDHENTCQVAETARILARKLGDQYWEANSLVILSAVARMFNEDADAVLRPARQARAIAENLRNPWGLVLSYATDAQVAFGTRDFEQLAYWSLKCLALAKVFGSYFFIGNSALYLGIAASWQGNVFEAWGWLCQALQTFWGAGHAHQIPVPMFAMAQVLLNENKADLAIEIFAVTENSPVYDGHSALFDLGPNWAKEMRRELEFRLGPDRFAYAWERGKRRGLGSLVAQLLSEELMG